MPTSALHLQRTSCLMTDSDDRPQLNENRAVQSSFQSTARINSSDLEGQHTAEVEALELVLHNCY